MQFMGIFEDVRELEPNLSPSGSSGSLWFADGSSGSRVVRLVHVVQEWLTLSGPIT